MKYHYKIILCYDGKNYCGFQYQSENPNTIQEVFQNSLAKVLRHSDYKLSFASRTDKGVSAKGQVLKLSLNQEIYQDEINKVLPNNIEIISLELIHNDFNPNTQVKAKTYHYYFNDQDLNIELMHIACSILKGRHDFSNFTVPGLREKDNTREILKCRIHKVNRTLYLEIKSQGFLKYMVRYIMGVLFQIGKEELTLENLNDLLTSSSKRRLPKAAPEGLYLFKIEY